MSPCVFNSGYCDVVGTGINMLTRIKSAIVNKALLGIPRKEHHIFLQSMNQGVYMLSNVHSEIYWGKVSLAGPPYFSQQYSPRKVVCTKSQTHNILVTCLFCRY